MVSQNHRIVCIAVQNYSPNQLTVFKDNHFYFHCCIHVHTWQFICFNVLSQNFSKLRNSFYSLYIQNTTQPHARMDHPRKSNNNTFAQYIKYIYELLLYLLRFPWNVFRFLEHIIFFENSTTRNMQTEICGV